MKRINYPPKMNDYESVFPAYEFFPVPPCKLNACVKDFDYKAYCHFTLPKQTISMRKVDLLQIAEILPELFDKMDECQAAVNHVYRFVQVEEPAEFQVGAKRPKVDAQQKKKPKAQLKAQSAAGKLPAIHEEEQEEEEEEEIVHVDPECEVVTANQRPSSLVLSTNKQDVPPKNVFFN